MYILFLHILLFMKQKIFLHLNISFFYFNICTNVRKTSIVWMFYYITVADENITRRKTLLYIYMYVLLYVKFWFFVLPYFIPHAKNHILVSCTFIQIVIRFPNVFHNFSLSSLSLVVGLKHWNEKRFVFAYNFHDFIFNYNKLPRKIKFIYSRISKELRICNKQQYVNY